MQSVKHKRSALLVNGGPKLPTISQLEVGEIAINFAEGHETLSTRNNNDGIATFSSDSILDKKYISSGAVVSAISAVTKTIEDNEYVIAQAFNDQNDRVKALEDAGFLTGYTETDPVFTSSPACGITSQNITDWTGKQDAISDLETIRYNAASGLSAYNAVTAHTGNTAMHLPTVSASDNGKILQVVNGQWALVTPTVIYTGNGTPDNTLGNNGDIYLQTS